MNKEISNKATEALNNRLKNSKNYSLEEINSVSNYDFRIFNRNYVLDKDSSTLLSNLCASSYLSRYLIVKKSHRALIGPVVFFFKKALCKILNPMFKTQFDQLDNFNRNAVLAIAKLYNSQKE